MRQVGLELESGATFTDDEGAPPSATVESPAPFSGHAEYRSGPGPPTWRTLGGGAAATDILAWQLVGGSGAAHTIQIVIPANKTAMTLLKHCVTGKHIESGTITVREDQADGGSEKFALTDATVAPYSHYADKGKGAPSHRPRPSRSRIRRSSPP